MFHLRRRAALLRERWLRLNMDNKLPKESQGVHQKTMKVILELLRAAVGGCKQQTSCLDC